MNIGPTTTTGTAITTFTKAGASITITPCGIVMGDIIITTIMVVVQSSRWHLGVSGRRNVESVPTAF